MPAHHAPPAWASGGFGHDRLGTCGTGEEEASAINSEEWDTRYAASELVWGAAANRWVVAEVADLPAGRALDLAAGEGRNSIWLAQRGWRVTAVDFASVAVERGRKLAATEPRAADRLSWVVADLRGYAPPPAAFDLVLIVYLHLPADQRRAVLRHAANGLAPGGTLLMVGHDTTNLTEGVGGPQDAGVLFTPDDVLADLADAGLETVSARRVRRRVPRPDDPDRADGPEAIDALVRLRRPA